MTTKDAFEGLINQRAWYKDLDIPETTATNLKSNFKLGKVSLEKMEEILQKAGYSVVIEKHWTKTHFTGTGPIYYIKDGVYYDVIDDEVVGDEEKGLYEDKK